MPRKILRVYYDLPNYIKPKEVAKAFAMMPKRNKLFNTLKNTSRQSKRNDIKAEIEVLDSNLRLILNATTPNNSSWSIIEMNDGTKKFNVLTIFRELFEEEPIGDQDDIT